MVWGPSLLDPTDSENDIPADVLKSAVRHGAFEDIKHPLGSFWTK
jgi:hypothetical protein